RNGAGADADAAGQGREILVGGAVAVVIHAVADLRRRRRVRDAGHGAAGAGVGPGRARAEGAGHGARGAAGGIPLVHRPVAVVVDAVAGLRGREVRLHAFHRAAGARGHAFGARSEDAGDAAGRASGRVPLVHGAVAVVVEAVAELLRPGVHAREVVVAVGGRA